MNCGFGFDLTTDVPEGTGDKLVKFVRGRGATLSLSVSRFSITGVYSRTDAEVEPEDKRALVEWLRENCPGGKLLISEPFDSSLEEVNTKWYKA